ncbi:MAG: hypothetical protein IJR80_10645 [Treponema sp.]|nr:hypothetical protein [Treponema sp.]
MGITKKLIISLVLAVFYSFASFATQISFQILQFDETCEEVNAKSYDIETYLLDGFFERNYIVTTSQASVIYNDDDAFDLWKTGLGEAFNGSSDYFVQIELHYAADMNLRKPVGMVNRITWKLAVVKTGTVIDGETVTDITKMSNGQEDLGALTLDLVKHINNAIKA